MNKQNLAIKQALNEVVSSETASELAYMGDNNLETTYHLLQEQMEYNGLMPEVPTVKSVLQNMKAMTQWENIRNLETGKFSTIEDVQEMFSEQIYELSELLGIELEG